jgi:CheY-like chemotaxis protein
VRVLIADPDSGRAKVIAEACAARGHVVDRAVHGAAALELGLERVPQVVLTPVDLPIIEGARLAEILRSNPRTHSVRFVFLVEDELDAPVGLDLRDRIAVAPWDDSDVMEHVDALAERDSRYPDVRRDAEIEGKLSRLGLVDLIQMFQHNRRNGTLRVIPDAGPSGALHITDGQVADALVPLADGTKVTGEKAAFRMLGAARGRFAFTPEEQGVEPVIARPTRALLLEAMRQIDEWEQHRGDLPSAETRLEPGPVAPGEVAALPVSREILALLDDYPRVGDLVDHCSVPDYQVLRALDDLIARGVLRRVETSSPEPAPARRAGGGLFTGSQLRRLREWLSPRGPRRGASLKVLVVAPEPRLVERFLSVLHEFPDFVADGQLAREPERLGGLGPLGVFALGEGLQLRVCAVPAAPAYAPAWAVAGHGMLGALVLMRAPIVTALQAAEPVVESLRGVSSRPLIWVLECESGAPTLGEIEREEIERAGGGPLFALSAEPDSDPERRAVVQNLFSRLIP